MTRSARGVASGAPIVTIRTIRPADFDGVRALTVAAYGEYAQLLPPEVWAHYERDLADVEHRAGAGTILVAESATESVTESDGPLVGTATFYPDASCAGMGWPTGCAAVRAVAVSPPFRSRGIGRQLMAHCADLARGAGARSLLLHTASFMTRATALYTHLGYVRVPHDDVDVCSQYDLDDQFTMTVLGYRLDLT